MKSAHSTSSRLRLIFIYLYFTLLSYTAAMLSFALSSEQMLKEAGVADMNERITMLLVATTSMLLIGWVLYSFHKRKARTGIIFVIFLLISYSISSTITDAGFSPLAVISTVIFVTADLLIVFYLFESKEAKTLFKHKGWW